MFEQCMEVETGWPSLFRSKTKGEIPQKRRAWSNKDTKIPTFLEVRSVVEVNKTQTSNSSWCMSSDGKMLVDVWLIIKANNSTSTSCSSECSARERCWLMSRHSCGNTKTRIFIQHCQVEYWIVPVHPSCSISCHHRPPKLFDRHIVIYSWTPIWTQLYIKCFFVPVLQFFKGGVHSSFSIHPDVNVGSGNIFFFSHSWDSWRERTSLNGSWPRTSTKKNNISTMFSVFSQSIQCKLRGLENVSNTWVKF